MAEDVRQSLDRKTKAVLKNDVQNGHELEALQSAQQQLLAIQAEQRQNLNVARAESNAEINNRNVLRQAGMMGMAMQAENQNQAPQQPQFNPQTQAILTKYGMGQPKIQRTQSHNQQVTKQHVVINNNTTNTTTNNVSVPGPVQGRELSFKQPDPKTSSMAQFKNWLDQSFTKQEEEGKKRDFEYKRREWSLTRSANKMMKKIEDIGRTMGERLDPRRIGSTWTSQLKSLLFVFGFGLLASNWSKILLGVTGIENKIKSFLEYFGVGKKGMSDFHAQVVRLFGGDPQRENALIAFQRLLLGTNVGTKADLGLFGLIKEWLGNRMKDRQEAVKLIKFPEINITDIPSSLKSVASYLSNVLVALMTGSTQAAKNQIGNDIIAAGSKSALSKDRWGDQGFWNNLLGKGKDAGPTSGGKNYREARVDEKSKKIMNIGDADLTLKDSNGKTIRQFNPLRDLDEEGNLDAHGSVVQLRDLDWTVHERAKEGKIDSAQVIGGLLRLKNSAEANGGVPVDKTTLAKFFNKQELQAFRNSKDIKAKNYKYVAADKTDKEYMLYDAGADFWSTALKNGVISNIANDFTGGITNTPLVGSAINTAARNINGTPNLSYTYGNWFHIGDVADAAKKFINKAGALSKYHKLVPVDDPRPGIKIDGKTAFTLYEISPRVIQKLAEKITKKQNVELDEGNKEFTTSVESSLEKIAKDAGAEKITRDTEESIKNQYKQVDKIENKQKERDEEYNIRFNESRAGKAKEEATKLIDTAKNKLGDVANVVKSEVLGAAENATDFLSKKTGLFKNMTSTARRGGYIAHRLKNELKLTDEQVAGIMGNLMVESSTFNTKAVGDNGAAIGIAQWHADRQAAAKKLLGKDLKDANLEEQTTFLIHELKNDKVLGAGSYNGKTYGKKDQRFVDMLKEQTNAADSAIAIDLLFERSNGEHRKQRIANAKAFVNDKSIYGLDGEDTTADSTSSGSGSGDSSDGGNNNVDKPKGLVETFRENISNWMSSFGLSGFDSGKYIDVSGITGPPSEEFDRPDYSYKGPITSEFKNYFEYKYNHGNLKPGMSYSQWIEEVRKVTGSLPQDLRLDTKADNARKEKLKGDSFHNFFTDSPENVNYKEYVKKYGNRISFKEWQEQVKNKTGFYPQELLEKKLNRKVDSQELLGNDVSNETKDVMKKYEKPELMGGDMNLASLDFTKQEDLNKLQNIYNDYQKEYILSKLQSGNESYNSYVAARLQGQTHEQAISGLGITDKTVLADLNSNYNKTAFEFSQEFGKKYNTQITPETMEALATNTTIEKDKEDQAVIDSKKMAESLANILDPDKYRESKKTAEEKQTEALNTMIEILAKIANGQKLGNELSRKIAEISATNVDVAQTTVNAIISTAKASNPGTIEVVASAT